MNRDSRSRLTNDPNPLSPNELPNTHHPEAWTNNRGPCASHWPQPEQFEQTTSTSTHDLAAAQEYPTWSAEEWSKVFNHFQSEVDKDRKILEHWYNLTNKSTAQAFRWYKGERNRLDIRLQRAEHIVGSLRDEIGKQGCTRQVVENGNIRKLLRAWALLTLERMKDYAELEQQIWKLEERARG